MSAYGAKTIVANPTLNYNFDINPRPEKGQILSNHRRTKHSSQIENYATIQNQEEKGEY